MKIVEYFLNFIDENLQKSILELLLNIETDKNIKENLRIKDGNIIITQILYFKLQTA